VDECALRMEPPPNDGVTETNRITRYAEWDICSLFGSHNRILISEPRGARTRRCAGACTLRLASCAVRRTRRSARLLPTKEMVLVVASAAEAAQTLFAPLRLHTISQARLQQPATGAVLRRLSLALPHPAGSCWRQRPVAARLPE
jgi:hypothetical protein